MAIKQGGLVFDLQQDPDNSDDHVYGLPVLLKIPHRQHMF